MKYDRSAYPDLIEIDGTIPVPCDIYGAKAAAIAKLKSTHLPVPRTWAVSVDGFRNFANSGFSQNWQLNAQNHSTLTEGDLIVSVRASPVKRAWAGPDSLLNVGMNSQIAGILNRETAPHFGDAAYFQFIQDFAARVARLDAEEFEQIKATHTFENITDFNSALKAALQFYDEEKARPFPQDLDTQLNELLRSMSRAWHGTSARIVRDSLGAPPDAGMGLVIQDVGLGLGAGEFGAGRAQFISPITGEELANGRYRRIRKEACTTGIETYDLFLTKDARGEALEDRAPKALQKLKELSDIARAQFQDECQLEFAVDNDEVRLLDARPAERSGRATVAIAVALQRAHIIDEKEALKRVDPSLLEQLLHPIIDPKAKGTLLTKATGASPGAATGALVFSAQAAISAASRGEAVILAVVETTPDDVHGMHSAQGILTERGALNGHAAVVARALGLPCIVNATDMRINEKDRIILLPNKKRLKEGDHITIDGSTGDAFKGRLPLLKPELGEDFKKLMAWADQTRAIGIRCNADTPQDVKTAFDFGVDGIGLIRTEHMFFDIERLSVIREMIFTDDDISRKAALDILLPMQRSDFKDIYMQAQEKPVTIRLLDPPLHEFLPKTHQQMKSLADAMDVPLSKVTNKVDDMQELNPMLGTRGVRLGITLPEIYDMQARAIFEGACDVYAETGIMPRPEIMIPLVSAKREVELIKSRIDGIASAVQAEKQCPIDFSLGVMIETPRAALRAGDIARDVDFISFGTNDLTQMTYGLSRDDAGRFMQPYLREQVFEADPFVKIDKDGVGQLIEIAVERSRNAKKDIQIGLCGEQAVDQESLEFCAYQRFDYISCSAYRTPTAKLAAAHAVFRDEEKQ